MNKKEIRKTCLDVLMPMFTEQEWNSTDILNNLVKQLFQLSEHSDKNTEAYCENLQRENDYLKEQLSRQDEVVAEGELNYINRGYTVICFGFNNKYKTCNNIEKYNGKNIIISIKEVE